MATAPGTCGLVVTGTMTNAALLFAAFPETAGHIRLSIMGGGFEVGNITRFAEFNIYCDPEAASSIFTLPALSGKILLAPLDLTHTVLATAAVRSTLLTPTPTLFRTMLHDLLMFFAGTYARVFGMTTGPPLHDPVAVAALLYEDGSDPALGFEWEECSIEIILQGEQLGKTVMWPVGAAPDNAHDGKKVIGEVVGESGVRVKVGKKVNADEFWRVMLAAVDVSDGVSPLNV
ncbi:hypothetical protein DRE_07717 [Drechslerella stenobrocha 248]|uniref:Inosine/uridine-preferring nucleoside hydrolase domain-containing protein n=1 Tax=Drechslerella stenobrocha 248 TaxID=1043628 RepID=W7I8Z2_9PEZI|nr:hypothetical protein DRE_07717 [Drechslerella stenobrocha 248]